MVQRLALLVAVLILGTAAGGRTQEKNRHLLLVLDGLRPDYVTREVMPNLHALGERGIVFENHHAVFPTVTRVNSSSISTGSYPERHGLLGNSVFFPRVENARFLNTGERPELLRIERDQDGVLLTATTLGEALHAHGRKMLAVGSGTTGSVFLLNHRVAGGAVLHTEYALPEPLHARIQVELGTAPPEGRPNDARNRRAVDALFRIGLPQTDPAVTVMWLSDPDTTAHALGMGHPTTVEALRRVDGEVKTIQDRLREAGLLDSYNIWVTSDHGFATHTGAADVTALLKPHSTTLPDGFPAVVHGDTAIYVRDGSRNRITAIVAALQKTKGIGAIFTRAREARSPVGWVGGTLSFDLVHWNHARSGDILYSRDWTDQRNQHGFAGTSASNGVAGHGSSSPFEIHNTLIAAGPDLKSGARVNLPSGNVDFAPTFLYMLGIPIPESMQGRPLLEALRAVDVQRTPVALSSAVYEAGATDGTYRQTAVFSGVRQDGREYRYLDQVKAVR